ncbi:MAG TPA: sugar diacid recognition domain-containing protein [Symbiobacteriaceae bacterium]|nr:sugar diacid recognition domain-containing protein [Symbiobacteriaceae bacterium]
MELTPELAQPIVERAIAILQRNVNIMDARGFIVGSGDPNRIGTFHRGAAAVLRTGRRVEIFPEDAAQWEGVRIGVNLALRLGKQIVGVVGITGPPDEVRPFGELIREMVQLMLVQVRSAEMERTTALAREAFLRDLLTGAGEMPDRLVREARLMGLGAETTYRVILCESLQAEAEPGNYTWVETVAAQLEAAARVLDEGTLLVTGPWEGRLVAVTGAMGDVMASRLAFAQGAGWALAAGLAGKGLPGIRRSYHTAILALTAGCRLTGAGFFLAEGLMLETLLATVAPEDASAFRDAVTLGLPGPGTRQGATFRQAIEAYARSGMSLAAAAEALGVHRHTLGYRLEQVTDVTGLDPRTWDGLLRLFLGLKMEQLFGPSVQS